MAFGKEFVLGAKFTGSLFTSRHAIASHTIWIYNILLYAILLHFLVMPCSPRESPSVLSQEDRQELIQDMVQVVLAAMATLNAPTTPTQPLVASSSSAALIVVSSQDSPGTLILSVPSFALRQPHRRCYLADKGFI
jgi:hypothetical protein